MGREHGTLSLGKVFKTFHVGDIVDLKGDGSVQKGMPHKYYHGKTGTVWNVTKRAIGVEVNKMMGAVSSGSVSMSAPSMLTTLNARPTSRLACRPTPPPPLRPRRPARRLTSSASLPPRGAQFVK